MTPTATSLMKTLRVRLGTPVKAVAVLIIFVCANSSTPAIEIVIEPDSFAEGTDLTEISPFVTMSVSTDTMPTPFAVTANEDLDGLQSTGLKVFGHVDVPFWSNERRLVLDFASPVKAISIDANGNFDLDPEIGTLEVYDQNGVLLDSFFTPSLSGDAVTMSIVRPQFDIAKAIAYPANGPFLRLDNLFFEFTSLACDFDGNGVCGIADLNAMLAIGPLAPGVPAAGNAQFDLNGDGVIDGEDVDRWLAIAATENGLASPYKRGDANLDGTVDGLDFILWNDDKFTSALEWNRGDFDSDGTVDGLDFILWNDSKFTSSDGINPVPEPSHTILFGCSALFGFAMCRRRSPCAT